MLLISACVSQAIGIETNAQIAILDYQKDEIVCEYATENFLTLPSLSQAEMKKMLNVAYGYASSNFSRVSRWPTDDEIKDSIATSSEIAHSIPGFVAWVGRILDPAYIPTDINKQVFGLKKWWEGEGDTLFSKYVIKGVEIRIVDAPDRIILTVLGDEFSLDVLDWRRFVDETCVSFFARPNRLRSYGRLVVAKLSVLDVAKINLAKWPRLDDETDNLYAWSYSGSTEIWISKGEMRVDLIKLMADSIPAGKDYGIRQRFPPLREVLKDASVEELLKHVSEDNTLHEWVVPLGLIEKRPDADIAVEPLISVYMGGTNLIFKTTIIQIVENIAVKTGGATAKKVEEFISGEIASKPGGILQDVLEKVLNNVKKKVASEATVVEPQETSIPRP
jgi:hypothetical protein